MNIAFFDHYTVSYRIKGAVLYKSNSSQKVIPSVSQFSTEIRSIDLIKYKRVEETMILHAIYSSKDKL